MVVAPGIYDGRSIDYEKIEAVNQSTLKAIARSPLHYRHRLEHAAELTVPMRLGSVAHTAVLEPNRLTELYAVWAPEGKKDDFRGKDFEAFATQAVIEGKVVIKRRDLEAATAIGVAVRGHALVQRYLVRGEAERVLVWRDERTDTLCKARLDFLSTAVAHCMCELKTARDVGPWAFSAAFAKLGYDIQAAWYADGYRAITGHDLNCKCIAVESVPPHDVIVYDLAEAIDVGREIYRELLDRLVECRKSNRWPGQASSEVSLQLPKWRTGDDEGGVDGLDLEFAQAEEAPP